MNASSKSNKHAYVAVDMDNMDTISQDPSDHVMNPIMTMSSPVESSRLDTRLVPKDKKDRTLPNYVRMLAAIAVSFE